MYHDVVDQRGLEHHSPPVEAQGAVGGAAPPPLALVADQHPRDRTPTQPVLPAGHAGRQPLLGPAPVPRHHRPPDPLSPLTTVTATSACTVHAVIARTSAAYTATAATATAGTSAAAVRTADTEAVAHTAIASISACAVYTAASTKAAHAAIAVHTAAANTKAKTVSQARRHGDAEAPVVEADLRRTGAVSRRLDDHADVAP